MLTRLSAQFRSMPESKLLGRLPDGRSRATAGHELAGLVALAAQGVEDRARPVPPSWRSLPFDGPFVVGDQIGVTGHDLLAACAGVAACADIRADGASGGSTDGSPATVWAPPSMRCGRAGIGTVLGQVLEAAEDLAGAI